MEQGRLADAGRADQGNQLAVGDLQAEVAQNTFDLAAQRADIGLIDVLELDSAAHNRVVLCQRLDRRSSVCIKPYSMTDITIQNTTVQAMTPATFCELNSELSW
jgi:hypothetical protein